jgi:hypothetical protein
MAEAAGDALAIAIILATGLVLGVAVNTKAGPFIQKTPEMRILT